MDFDISKYSARIDAIAKSGRGLCFGYMYDDKEGDIINDGHLSQPCHGTLNGKKLKSTVGAFYTTLRTDHLTKYTKPFANKWLEYILSDDGPYKEITAGRQKVIFGEGKGYSLEVHEDDDMILLCNLAIASRYSFEYFNSFKLLEAFVEKGLIDNIGEAFFLSANLVLSNDASRPSTVNVNGQSPTLGSGHCIVPNDRHGTIFDLQNWLAGKKLREAETTLGQGGCRYGVITAKFSRRCTPSTGFLRPYMLDINRNVKKIVQIKSRWALTPVQQGSVLVPLEDVASVWKDGIRDAFFEHVGKQKD